MSWSPSSPWPVRICRVSRTQGQKLEEISSRFDQLHRQLQLQDEITEAVAYSVVVKEEAFQVFSSRLQDYLKAYPTEPCSRAFQQILKERPLWDAVEAWNRLVDGWKTYRDGLPPQEAEQRANRAPSSWPGIPVSPVAPRSPGINDTPRRSLRRMPGKANPAARLRRVFSASFIENVWMVVVNEKPPHDQAHYYMLKPPEAKNSQLNFTAITDIFGKDVGRSIPLSRIASKGLSPQSQLAEQIKPILADGSKLSRWEATMIDMILAIFHQSDIDPILQVILLKVVIGVAVEGSEPMRIALEAMKTQLDQASLDLDINWINPDTPGLASVQHQAHRLIESLRTKVPTAKHVLDLRDQIEQTVSMTYRPVGRLVRDDARIEVGTGGVVPRQGDLWIVTPSASHGGAWKKVGIIHNNKPLIEARDASALIEGRPVFVLIRTSL